MNHKDVTPAAIARKWFKEHPRVVVDYHHRREQLSPSHCECMDNPRTVRVSRNRLIFHHSLGYSEMNIQNLTSAEITDDDKLAISFSCTSAVPEIIYRGANL